MGDTDASFYLSFVLKKQNPFKFQAITLHNIIRCISKMKNSKSYKIATKFVKDSIEITAPMLSIIFHKSISQGVFPRNLTIGKVCPVYKGKGSKSDPDNYRPITVLSVFARLFEKLIHEQLFLYFNDYLYKKQSGFQNIQHNSRFLIHPVNGF